MMNSPEVGFSSDIAVLRMLSEGKARPNVMVMNAHARLERIVDQLSAGCQLPIQLRRFPGILDLPAVVAGTLLLADIDQLTISQQIALSDWLWRTKNEVQVVSIARVPMMELIAEGRFLEGLFYRLNTVVLRTVDGHDFTTSW